MDSGIKTKNFSEPGINKKEFADIDIKTYK